MIKYKLTEQQIIELKNIQDLINSNDEECISLGIALLDSYPDKMKVLQEEFTAFGLISIYSPPLRRLLNSYNLQKVHNQYGYYRYPNTSLSEINRFISSLIINGIYYEEV